MRLTPARMMAVGTAYSATLGAWTSRVSAADSDWLEIAAGGSILVAARSNTTGSPKVNDFMYSTNDGVTWTLSSSNITVVYGGDDWSTISHGNGLFVAHCSGTPVSGKPFIVTSADGVTWDTRGSSSDFTMTGSAYGNGVYVAAGSGGTVDHAISSLDGINWTNRNTASNGRWDSMAFGNGIIVAVASDSGAIMTTTDGATWTSRTNPGAGALGCVTFGGDKFVALSKNSSGDNYSITSTDGITWALHTALAATAREWESIAYSNTFYAAVASGRNFGDPSVMTSTTGTNDWVLGTLPAANRWYGITGGTSGFTAVSDTGVGNRVMTASITVAPT